MWLRRLVTGLLAVLLVPAALLTCARLLEPHGRVWVALVAFTPYAIPLYAGAALLLLLVWWRSAGRSRAAAKAMTFVCLAALTLHLAWARGPYVGPPPAATSPANAFVVMTANLHLGQADPADLVRAAVRHRIDVLVLEEVTPQALRGLREAGLARVLPHRAGRPDAGAAGTMVFARTRLSGAHRLDTRFGSYTVRVRDGADKVTLLAVHTRPPLGGPAGWTEDLNTVRAAAVGHPGPVVLAGDFNATTDHLPMRDLAGRGFLDAATEARSRWQPTWPEATRLPMLGVQVPALLAVDHVLVDGLHATGTTALTLPGSDHRALLAVLSR